MVAAKTKTLGRKGVGPSRRHPAEPATGYALAVVGKKVPACKWVKLACKRHLADLKRKDIVWEGERLYPRLREFCGTLRWSTGEWAGQPVVLHDWQWFFLLSLLGWRRRSDGFRRFLQGYLEVPRKNGKTPICAILGLWCLVADGEASAEVYSVATKEDQAKISWRDGVAFVQRSPGWGQFVRVRVKEIDHPLSGSFWRPLGSDSATLDGLRPSCVLADELHAWRDRALWDVLNSAFGGRRQPLFAQITTAGDNPDGLCFEQRKALKRILEKPYGMATKRHEKTRKTEADGDGDLTTECTESTEKNGSTAGDDSMFGVIYEPDEGDDWRDERVWHKVNPGLGTVKRLSDMRRLASAAETSPGARRDFFIKQLDMWQTTGAQRWLDLERWDVAHSTRPQAGLLRASSLEAPREPEAGCTVWGALDLARVNDLAAFCLVGEDPADAQALRAWWWFFLPEEGIAEKARKDNAPYDTWAREGWLTLTPGDMTDFDEIGRVVAAQAARLDLKMLKFDPYGAPDLARRLKEEHGIPVEAFPQTYGNYALPMKEVDRVVAAGRLHHGGNPIARMCAANCTVRVGPSGNMMPDKARSNGRIDGMSALAMAVGAKLVMPEAPVAIGAAWM
jgi:phage terminase large subunit-like protein